MPPRVQNRLRLESTVGSPLPVGEARLEQRPQRLEQKVFGQMPVYAYQPLAGIDVDARRREQFVERGKRAAGKRRVAEGFAQCPVQGVAAVMVDGLPIRAALQQRFHQRHVARRRSRHQRGLVHGETVLDAMLVALPQDVPEAAGEILDIGLAPQRRALLLEAFRGVELRLPRKPGRQHRLVEAGGVFVELLLHLAARCLFAKHLEQEFIDLRLAEHRPGHGRLLEDGAPDRFGLLLFPLEFELARFLLPVLQGRLRRFHFDLADGHVEQAKERVPGVRFDDVQIPDGARQRDIEGVDEELIDLQRLVALILRPPVIQAVGGEIGLGDAFDNIGELRPVIRDEAVEDDVFVFEPLGFMDGEQQRCGEVLSRPCLVFVAHHQHGELGGLTNFLVELAHRGVPVRHERHLPLLAPDRLHQEVALPVDRAEAPLLDLQQLVGYARCLQPIAEVGGEHAQFLPFGQFRILPEQALHLPPGEEIRMDDLV